jgi:hypothetical protein
VRVIDAWRRACIMLLARCSALGEEERLGWLLERAHGAILLLVLTIDLIHRF